MNGHELLQSDGKGEGKREDEGVDEEEEKDEGEGTRRGKLGCGVKGSVSVGQGWLFMMKCCVADNCPRRQTAEELSHTHAH